MPPVQSVGNVANAPSSPKKSKKNKKDKAKNRTTSEKERENKSSSEREKEVSVEKSLEATVTEKAVQSQRSPPRDLCPAKLAKNKDNVEKKSNKNDKSAGAEVAPVQTIGKDAVASKGGVSQPSGQCSLASEVAKARQHIKNSLECMDSVAALAGVPNVDLINKVNSLEKENKELKRAVDELRKVMQDMKVNFEAFTSKFTGATAPASAPVSKAVAGGGTAVAPPREDSDDGVDLFGSDDEEESAEAIRLREERLAAYNAKKSKKPVLIAKSNIILDVKPWDDETDMSAMEAAVRGVTADGLLWGAAKLVPLAYGIHKLQISCVVEDDKVSIDWLQEELEKIEDFVQSVDIAAFNKV